MSDGWREVTAADLRQLADRVERGEVDALALALRDAESRAVVMCGTADVPHPEYGPDVVAQLATELQGWLSLPCVCDGEA